MIKILKKVFTISLCMLVLLGITSCSSVNVKTVKKEVNTNTGEYAGKTVILHSNDVHGAVEGYSYMASLKAEVEKQGGTVITVDAGDFTNGNIYVSVSKGESAVTLMNQVGYDIATVGNHEFDFGFENLKNNLSKAEFVTLTSNIFENDKTIFDQDIIYQVGDLKVAFFALSTPETQTKVNPSQIKGLKFTEKEELYKVAQDEVDRLKTKADVVICIAHLGVDDESTGNRSLDVVNKVEGIDFVIDGHSHTVMTSGENGEYIQSTGTAFENIGLITIDNKTKKIVENKLIETSSLTKDSTVEATALNVIATVDEQFGAEIAKTSVDLVGEKAQVRTQTTNLADLITDAMAWSIKNEATLKVDADKVVVITNGGGIRASIATGSVSRKDIKNVLPFGNTLAVTYVKGSELLEALEASTFATPDAIGGFPQIANMKITVDTTKAFDQGEQYPDSTFFKPNSINRVTINEINGKAFDENETYAVITNNFCAEGGDTYYAFMKAYQEAAGFDTSIPMDDAVSNYIISELKGEIGDKYANPSDRITIIK